MKRYSHNRDIQKFIVLLLKSNNNWRFKKGKKHNKLISPYNRIFTIPSSPSCSRAYQNFKHDILKLMRGQDE